MDDSIPLNEFARYSAFVRENRERIGPLGDVEKGEIQIVTDFVLGMKCVIAVRKRLERNLATEDEQMKWTRPGVVYEDQYAQLVRFPVLFPPKNGAKDPVPGLYIIWYWKSKFLACGMPVMRDGRIVLQKEFRHATRSWTLGFPRGGANDGDVLTVLRRELKEEAGIVGAEVIPLGELECDNGLLGQAVPVYLVRIAEIGESRQEYAEAISGLVFFTVKEFERLLVGQVYEADGRVYRLRGSFENFAFTQARLRGLI